MSPRAPDSQEAIYYGEDEEVELTNWEEMFKNHIEETKLLEKVREEKIEKADKKEKSWELLRVCTAFIKENESSWTMETGGPRLKQKIENKNRRLELA